MAETERDLMMRSYYERVFPFELIAQWLAYGTDKAEAAAGAAETREEADSRNSFLKRREFACVLERNGEETFLRYRSFQNAKEMRSEFRSTVPTRIEIGPIYTHPVLKSNKGFNAAEQRELIFGQSQPTTANISHRRTHTSTTDIDMDSYNEVRRCCTGNAVCRRCWPLATVAAKVINHALRECFGFKHLLWVFSGRRGIHCWVADKRARHLRNEARDAIISFMAVLRGGQGPLCERVQHLAEPLHPSLRWACDRVVRPFFVQQYLESQGLLADADSRAQLLQFIRADAPRAELAHELEGMDDTRAMWHKFEECDRRAREKSRDNRSLPAGTAVALTYTYPRFDANVTTAINHLLKAPFCVHPASGKISVPIDFEHIDDFDIDAVPTLAQVADDLAHARDPAERLQGALDVLRAFVSALEQDPDQQEQP